MQITLSEQNSRRAADLASRTGKSAADVVNEALERYLAKTVREPAPADWKTDIMQAAGMWKDRDDLPDFNEIRKSFDQ